MEDKLTIIIPASIPIAILMSVSIYLVIKGAFETAEAGSYLRGVSKLKYQIVIMFISTLFAVLLQSGLPVLIPEITKYPDEFNKLCLAAK